jgi:Ser/Thr protein kinase RdoA (MazF antagonist)
VDTDVVERAVAAVKAVSAELELPAHDVVVLQNSNKLALRLAPCDVFARVAPEGQTEVAALEVELAQKLVAAGAPVVALDARVAPRVYERDGFAITFWTYHHHSLDQLPPADFARALERLHEGMRNVEVATPHFTDRIEEAEQLVANRDRTPALDTAGRELLLGTLTSARRNIDRAGTPEQLLHGEPHSGNVLNTGRGPVFIDLETCCRGPIEFDIAHVPNGVAERYAGANHDLVGECRRLVLAMVAAWRWDADDEFPDGLRHGRAILNLLSNGPPWPALGELA